MEEELIYRAEYIIHTYEIDFRGRARPDALLNYLQDTAGAQARELGFSVEALFGRGLTWVLSRYHIKIDRFPRLGEKIVILTWPSGRSEYHALRDWEILDAKGQKILRATSSWMVISLERKQPIPIETLYAERLIVSKRALEDDFSPLPILPSATREVEFGVELSHLDLNRHVNNVVYVHWALEGMPAEILFNFSPVEIEVAYRAEAVYGHRVLSRLYAADEGKKEFWHQIARSEEGRELARLRTRWQQFS